MNSSRSAYYLIYIIIFNDLGKCFCKPGVTGFRCDKCLPLHFGFGSEGCSKCDCHEKGSRLKSIFYKHIMYTSQ